MIWNFISRLIESLFFFKFLTLLFISDEGEGEDEEGEEEEGE